MRASSRHIRSRGLTDRERCPPALEEIADRHAQHLRDLVEPAGRNAIDAALVFVGLLVGHADQVGQLLLGQAQHDAALADPRADVVIDILRPPGRAARRRGAVGQLAALPRPGALEIRSCWVISVHSMRLLFPFCRRGRPAYMASRVGDINLLRAGRVGASGGCQPLTVSCAGAPQPRSAIGQGSCVKF